MEKTYDDGKFLTYLPRDESQYNTSHGDSKPESDGSHTGWERLAFPDLNHERHEPSSKGNCMKVFL